MIQFGNITYIIYIGIATAIVLILYILYLFWKRQVLSQFYGTESGWSNLIKGSSRISQIRSVIIGVAIVLAGFILLRPQWGERIREVRNEGSDVLIALDVSRSMLAQDVQPSRLGRAKAAVKWIAESLQGDRIGLIVFAGDAFLQCPLTNDIGAFMMFLDGADPDAINTQGTDIGRVLQEATRVFEKKRLTSKMLVLITDGEDHEGHSEKYMEKFRDLDVAVYTIGVGRDSGEIIPLSEDDGSGDTYLRDNSDKLVRSHRNEGLLKNLATYTRGSYIDISENLSGLSFILEIIEDQQRNEYGSRIIREPKEQYQYFVILLVILLSFEILLAERKMHL